MSAQAELLAEHVLVGEPIAVIGMAARVPGANDLDTFWRNLVDGVESISFFTREQELAEGADEEELDDPSYIAAAGVIDDMEQFDAALFGYTAREAEIADPQLRIFLEQAHAALLDAGYDSLRYPGEVAVYAGAGAADYHWRNIRRNQRVMAAAGELGLAVGNHSDYIATTVSYRLNLRGPALTLHTACSSSLVAVHLACEALRGGECDMALAGGVSVELPHRRGFVSSEGYVSPDGHCRPFDAKANGTIWGSGVGVAVLKRLADATRDGDRVYAVLLGNAINNDGATKVGFSAPSVDGQAEVIRHALEVGAIDPVSIGYVEAHGTGTALGDPIEVSALSTVYTAQTSQREWCGIGSVKSNVGHLSQAAGIVAMIKTALAVHHGIIPPSINFTEPNPAIDFAATPFYVNATLSTWDNQDRPRRAAVSSFGIGGTNAHVVLQEPPSVAPAPPGPGPELVQISALTESAAAKVTSRLAEHLSRQVDSHHNVDLADVAYTLRVGRAAHRHRTAVVAANASDAAAALGDKSRLIRGEAADPAPRVAMLFTGQGAQFAGMASELYQREPIFAAALDECAQRLALQLDLDLRTIIFAASRDGGDASRAEAEEQLRQTALTQPALFSIEYALACLWRQWGVQPAAMIGHSIGEYVAATLAGVFALPDALRLVATRGALIQAQPAGAMLAVQRSEQEMVARLPAELDIATVNGPGTCVVAGPIEAVTRFAEALRAEKVRCTELRTSHAFHSAMMAPVLPEFTAAVAAVPRQAPRVPFVSNVTGDWISAEQATDPAYWANHLRSPVRFGDCVATLVASGDWTLLECGPGRTLAGLARMQLPKGVTPLHSLPGPTEPIGDLATIYAAAAKLWVAGVPVDVGAGRRDRRHRVGLPGYPYERTYLWVSPDLNGSAPAPKRRRRPVRDWLEVPLWRQVAPAPVEPALQRCLIFTGDERGEQVAQRLRADGAEPVLVRPGDRYRSEDGQFWLRPAEPDDYSALVREFAGTDLPSRLPSRIIHAWALAGDELDLGFTSLLRLTQAMAAAGLGDGIRLDVLTDTTLDVRGGEATRPLHASVAGVVRVAPREMPGLTATQIDIDGAAFDPTLVLSMLRRPAEGALSALRGGRVWRREFAPAALGDSAASHDGRDLLPVRAGGRYLITGGLGGIGITIAEELGVRHQARLALLSRSGLPPRSDWDNHLAVHGERGRAGRAIRAIQRMERAGASVLVLSANVADPVGLRQAREQVLAAFGGLDGIVHAAGIAGGGMIEVKQASTVAAVLEPKVSGTLALAQVFADLPLEFLALCSSVIALTGDLGQVDYCAANSFLDAYAQSRHGWPGRVVSINWGGWSEVGMAVETAAGQDPHPSGTPQLSTMEHPVLTEVARGTGDAGTGAAGMARGRISSASQWLLDEHRIAGTPVLPGTAQLETIRAAFAAAVPAPRPASRVELRDVVFVAPVSVPDGAVAELRVSLRPGTEGHDVEVTSICGGQTRVHTRASATWVEPDPAPTVDLDAILARCRRVGESEPISIARTSMLTFGPRWTPLAELYLGQDEEFALIHASDQVAAELPEWGLHPALLDLATAFGSTRGSGSYLPFGYSQLLVRSPLPARFYSHLRYRDTDRDDVIAADLSLLNPAGQVLVEVGEFLLRRVDPGAFDATLGSPGQVVEPASPPLAGSAPQRIAPADGVAALLRVLAAPELGSQVVVSAVAVDDLSQAADRVSAAATQPVTDSRAAVDGGDGGAAPPRTALEATIAEVWRDVLGVATVGADSDFFDLGGNSLVAVQLIGSVRRATGVRLPMRALFEAPTVAGLAARIEQLKAQADAPDQQAIPRLTRPS